MRRFNGDKAMTCKECFHYEACKTMLESMGHVVDGEGEYASLVCNEFQAAADVVSVVRCKNCKWWTGSECRNVNGANTTVFNPYWFCCSGQRKETEDV